MKLGLESFSTRNSGLDPVGVIDLAAELGFDGVLFELSPFRSFRDDDLKKIRHAAEEKGLFMEFGMGSILYWHPMAEKGRQLLAEAGYDTSVSDAQIVIDHLHVAILPNDWSNFIGIFITDYSIAQGNIAAGASSADHIEVYLRQIA